MCIAFLMASIVIDVQCYSVFLLMFVSLDGHDGQAAQTEVIMNIAGPEDRKVATYDDSRGIHILYPISEHYSNLGPHKKPLFLRYV